MSIKQTTLRINMNDLYMNLSKRIFLGLKIIQQKVIFKDFKSYFFQLMKLQYILFLLSKNASFVELFYILLLMNSENYSVKYIFSRLKNFDFFEIMSIISRCFRLCIKIYNKIMGISLKYLGYLSQTKFCNYKNKVNG